MSGLNPETLYVIERELPNGELEVSYARTPDGVGCYFYDADDLEEARGDVCEPTRRMTFDSHREFDNYRDRMAMA